MSAIHGGIDPWAMHEAGVDPATIKDFSISINPAPLPESIRDAISSAALYRYPDVRSRALVDALSREYGPSPEEIMVVNGTSQAIFLLAASFLKPGDAALVAGPAYGEYRDACEAYGARVVEYRAREDEDFHPGIPNLVAAIESEKPKICWMCNPNSPTGAWIDAAERRELARACAENGCVLVLDEAYALFAPPGLLPENDEPGAVHLRSMTKDFSIPGLRLGWVRADSDVIRRLERLQPDWSVSAPAQDAGVACLEHLPYFRRSWDETRRLRGHLDEGLRTLGWKPVPGAANFVLVRIGGDADVKALSAKLWDQRILVRDCASFGLEGCIRIGVRSEEDIDDLLALIPRAPGEARR